MPSLIKSLRAIANAVTPASKNSATANQAAAAEAREALARLRTERAVATESLASGHRRRRELLLDDAPTAALAKLDREMDGARLQLERLEIVEEELNARLAALRVEARAIQWASISDRYEVAAAEFVKTARVTLGAFQALRAIREEAQVGGFYREALLLTPPPAVSDTGLMLAPDHVDRFEKECAAASRHAPPPQPKPSTPPMKPPAPSKPAPAPAKPKTSVKPPAPPAPRTPPKPGEDGKIPMIVLRSGIEDPETGIGRRAGARIRMTSAAAEQAMRAGTVDYAYDEPPTP